MNEESIGAKIGTTLDRFIKHRESEFPYASGELSQLLRDIALAGKIINLEINRSGLSDITGAIGTQNIQGEQQQKLDVIANIRFIRAMKNGGQVCAIVSEEDDEVLEINRDSKYVVAMDPLDGSSNIDVNVSIGTIFSIYRRKSSIGGPIELSDVLQKGEEQVAAGYVLYGSSTMMVYTTGHGTNGFTLEPSVGEFILSHPQMKCPKNGSIYSINEGAYFDFEEGVQHYINECKEKRFSARYIGSLVADFHRNLLKGGIYMYPKTDQYKNGKLRLVYECNALAFIIEQAGGLATDGDKRIMELEPIKLHERAPLFIGCELMVKELTDYLNNS